MIGRSMLTHRCLLVALVIVSLTYSGVTAGPLLGDDLITDVKVMQEFLTSYSVVAAKGATISTNLDWNYSTNMTDENYEKASAQTKISTIFWKKMIAETKKYDWKNVKDESIRRQFSSIAAEGITVLSDVEIDELREIGHFMSSVYSKASATRTVNGKKEILQLDPGFINLMASSTNYAELTWAFKTWRDISGKKMKAKYARKVELLNKAARLNGYADEGAYWRSWYEVDDFEKVIEDLYQTIKPFYQNLHAYIRRKLQGRYEDHEFPATGHIPAHLFGNMWAQTWTHIYDLVKPFSTGSKLDVTEAMVEQGYTAKKMFKMAEEFFTSIGLPKMVDSFWTKSMFVRPKGRSVVCHPSAWDFYTGNDFRIKMCAKIVMEDLITIHHEMGHNQYQHLYSNQPMPFRDGANNGFHEAIGDTIALSVATPEHMKKIHLITKIDNDEHGELNYLMSVALRKIAFLPFGYMMDKYRWGVFDGTTTPANYTRHWWDLRCKYQGISPPVTRGPDDFDPGSKFHIAFNVAYIRYFISYVIQFQFHDALCKESGHKGPLHKCDIYQSIPAGNKLKKMLKMGASEPWPKAMFALTGQYKMKADSLVKYFKPLNDFLERENRGHETGWTDACPKDYYSAGVANTAILSVIAACLFATSLF